MNEHLEAYKRVFPAASLTIFQQEMIEMRIEDAGAWNKTLTFWAGNDYRPQSVFKMCQYYDDLMAKKGQQQVGRTNPDYQPEAIEPCVYCGREICLSLHREERVNGISGFTN